MTTPVYRYDPNGNQFYVKDVFGENAIKPKRWPARRTKMVLGMFIALVFCATIIGIPIGVIIIGYLTRRQARHDLWQHIQRFNRMKA